MKTLAKVVLIISTLLFATPGLAQSDVADVRDVNEELKLAAVEALMSAPVTRKIPRALVMPSAMAIWTPMATRPTRQTISKTAVFTSNTDTYSIVSGRG